MARNIRFPLKMKNGAEVRSLDELKENFDLESVLGYFTDGKLSKWLADRYYDEKAEAVAALSSDTPGLNAKLCEILEVEYQAEADETDLEEIQRRKEKYQILCAVTDNRDVLDNVDLVAMDQDELFDILDEDTDKVYLYGEKFNIPFGRKNITYIGVNAPLVLLGKDKTVYDFEERSITFSNVIFEEAAKKKPYPDPVGEFEIEDNVLKKGTPDNNGVCIIPFGVTSIGRDALNGCKSLKSVTIPDSVTSIGVGAFSKCTRLKSVTIPDSVTSIGDYAFYGTPWLEKMQAQNPLVIINHILIDGRKCSGAIYIPDSVTFIGEGAFFRCTSLKSVTIPDSVTSIGDNAFNGCKSLESVTIPDSVTSIGCYAFSKCTSLKSVTIPDSVTSIVGSAFKGCKSLESVTIPDSVTSIEYDAFYGCTSLKSVTIPDSVTSIGYDAFYGTPWLEKMQAKNPLVIINHILIDGKKCSGAIYILHSVTSIGGYAFYECTSLESVTIPDSVTSIGDYAFEECTSLKSVTISDSVTSIGGWAFNGCTSLENVDLPDGIDIGSEAFKDTPWGEKHGY